MPRGSTTILLGSLLVLTVAGFRCPGAEPKLLAAGAGGRPDGGAPPGCPELLVTRDVLEEPRDAWEGAPVAFLVELDPDAEAHVVAVRDEAGEMVHSAPVDAERVIIPPQEPGLYQASVTALRADCPISEARTQKFAVCETMWSESSLPREVQARPVVAADGKVVAISDEGTFLVAAIEPGGTLGSWSVLPEPSTGSAFGVSAAHAAGSALPPADEQRIWYLGGTDPNGQPGSQVWSVPTQGSGSLAQPPPAPLSDSPLEVNLLDAAAAPLSGHLLLVGGLANNLPSRTVLGRPYGPNGFLGESWFEVGDHPAHPCDYCTAVSFEDHLYVIGGQSFAGGSFDLEFHDTVLRGAWNEADYQVSFEFEAPLPEARSGARAAIDPTRRRLFVVGGASADEASTPDVFVASLQGDGSIADWNVSAPLPEPAFLHGLVWTDDHLHVVGGEVSPNSVYSLALVGPEGAPVCPAGSL